jgi:hypothetical protein
MGWRDWLKLASEFGVYARILWALAALVLMAAKEFMPAKVLTAVRFIYHEFKPFYWPSMIVTVISYGVKGTPPWLTAFALIIAWINWHFYKDVDDDDDRKKKLTETVKQVGGKLVVTAPEPAASRA